ncbi:unnamed protein product [Pseudo-nitzschia multistriata]|uniref:Uncharacterized protein n=1 Tax=Pseudo-nitzschia multistriata TaxID=183589 RepID=A0A448ZRA9_9STRA|nr:unnamed protein product [Pseudo-nitzschia multistriata]
MKQYLRKKSLQEFGLLRNSDDEEDDEDESSFESSSSGSSMPHLMAPPEDRDSSGDEEDENGIGKEKKMDDNFEEFPPESWDDEIDGNCTEALGNCMFTKSELDEFGGDWSRLVALPDTTVRKRLFDFQKRHLVFRIAWSFFEKKMGGVILSNTRQTKHQAIEFYDIVKVGHDGREPHIEVQYGNSPNKEDAEIFLRDETIEYIECTDEVARAFEKHVMASSVGNGMNDMCSGLVFIQGFFGPISPEPIPCDEVEMPLIGAAPPIPDRITFGVEFELSCSIGSQPQTVGLALVNHAGVRAKLRVQKYARPGHYHLFLGSEKMEIDNDSFGEEWTFVNDSSIEGNPDHAHSCQFELVSPVLRGENGVEVCRKVFTTALDTSAIHVNRSMGFHVHVGIPDEKASLAMLQYISYSFCRFEPVMDSFLDESRTGNLYCKSNRDGVLGRGDEYKEIPKFAKRITPAMENETGEKSADDTSDDNDDESTLHGNIFSCGSKAELFALVNPSGRYHKLNLMNLKTGRQPTIEFRQHNATDVVDEIEAWIRFCVAFVERCIDRGEFPDGAASEPRTSTGMASEDASLFDELFRWIGDDGLRLHFRRRLR